MEHIEMRKPTATEYEIIERTLKNKIPSGHLITLFISLLVCVGLPYSLYMKGLNPQIGIAGVVILVFLNVYLMGSYFSLKHQRQKALSKGEVEVLHVTCTYKEYSRERHFSLEGKMQDLTLSFVTEFGTDIEIENPTLYGNIKKDTECLLVKFDDYSVISLMS